MTTTTVRVIFAMAIIAFLEAVVGFVTAASPDLPIQLRHMGGGLGVGGVIMLLFCLMISLIIKSEP